MRIISGKYKGRRFKINPKVTARPTTDFAKEGLFNVLNNQIDFEGITVLDLFAGIGSLSFEFISRGALSVHAIEFDFKNIAYMQYVMSELKEDKLLIQKANVFKFLDNCYQQFDLIFADPPYDMENIEDVPKLIFEKQLLAEGGIFILEHSKNEHFDTNPHFNFMRKYGNVHFSFFK